MLLQFSYPEGLSWSWSCGSWIYNDIFNQCLTPLTFLVRIPLRRGVLDTTLCDKVCQWLAQVRGYFPGIPVSSANKTDRQDITEILLKVALNTITLTRTLLSRSLPFFYGEILRGFEIVILRWFKLPLKGLNDRVDWNADKQYHYHC
jgi:hypothetical protein